MYQHCIFCSRALGRNESLEHFPVGRTIAFDAGKGRLWAVCPRCGRWNLAPLEERWEAVESADRLFVDTRQRVHAENIGLAHLNDGTRLVRIGRALPAEFAAWRYGRQLADRRRRYALGVAASATVGLSALSVGVTPVAAVGLLIGYGWILWDEVARRHRASEVIHLPCEAESASSRPVLRGRIAAASLVRGADDEIALNLDLRSHGGGRQDEAVTLTGADASSALGRLLRQVNPCGAGHHALSIALGMIECAGSSDAYLRQLGSQSFPLDLPGVASDLHLDRFLQLRRSVRRARQTDFPPESPVASLALEIALHEQSERQVFDGELSFLRARWQQAEEIAAIADSLAPSASVMHRLERLRSRTVPGPPSPGSSA